MVGENDVRTFLEAVVGYIRSLDPRKGEAVRGNEDARQNVNKCKSIIGIPPINIDIPHNIARIEKILTYLDPHVRNNTSLDALLNRTKKEIQIYHEKSTKKQTPHLKAQTDFEKRERHYALSTREVLRSNYIDFHDIFRNAQEIVINQLRSGISPEILRERFKQMKERIEQEYTGGIDGLKIYFDAKHSDILYAASGGNAEEQKYFLFRMAKTLITASLSNDFYDLYKRISDKAKEDLYPFVFRMAKKFTDIKAYSPEARITSYVNADGDIKLKEK